MAIPLKKLINQMNNSVIPSEQMEAMQKLLNYLLEPSLHSNVDIIFLELVDMKDCQAVFTKKEVRRVELINDIIYITSSFRDDKIKRVYGDFNELVHYFKDTLLPINDKLMIYPEIAEYFNAETKEVKLKDGTSIYFDDRCAEDFKKLVSDQFNPDEEDDGNDDQDDDDYRY
jgi:hypothetical protein